MFSDKVNVWIEDEEARKRSEQARKREEEVRKRVEVAVCKRDAEEFATVARSIHAEGPHDAQRRCGADASTSWPAEPTEKRVTEAEKDEGCMCSGWCSKQWGEEGDRG